MDGLSQGDGQKLIERQTKQNDKTHGHTNMDRDADGQIEGAQNGHTDRPS